MTNGNPLHQNLIAHPAPADTVGAPVFDRAGMLCVPLYYFTYTLLTYDTYTNTYTDTFT